MYIRLHVCISALSLYPSPHQPALRSGVPGTESGSGLECVSNNNCQDYLFIFLIILVTCMLFFFFFTQAFVWEETEAIRQLRAMGDSMRSSFALVKNQNEASAHETSATDLVFVCDNWIRNIFQTVHSYIKAKLVKVSRMLNYFLLKLQLLKDDFPV